MRRWEDAERHFEDALAMNTRMGARPWVARSQFDYATMLLRRNSEGDRERALALLQLALATAREIGMAKVAADCEALLAAPSTASPGPLRTAGHYLWKCAGIREAIDQSDRLRPDVIVIDEPSGADKQRACALLRRYYPQARCIGVHAHTAHDHEHTDTEGHLHKPFHADDLLAAVEDVREQPLRSPSAHHHR